MPDGYVVRGHRHDDCYLNLIGLRQKEDLTKPRYDKAAGHQAAQGFLTTHGRFVDRQLGALLEQAHGLISAHTGQPFTSDTLFSEDLY